MSKHQKQVLDFKPAKQFSVAQSNEHKRNWSDKMWQKMKCEGNYDRTRERLNFEIAKGKVVPVDKTKTIPKQIKELLQSRGIADPNEGKDPPIRRIAVNFIFGGSRERMHQLAFGEQVVDLSYDADNSSITRCSDIEKWAQDVYAFVAGKFGEENIASFIIHLDETNPHVHCSIVPIVNGEVSYKKMFHGYHLDDTSAFVKQLHDEFAKVNEKWGLERGEDIRLTGAKHRTTEQYRYQLSQICNELGDQIEERKALLRQLGIEAKHAETRVKGLNTMIANLESEKEELERNMQQLAADIKANRGDSEELQRRVDRLSKEYEKVVGDIADKRQKLFHANQQLNEIRHKVDEARGELNEARADAEEQRQRSEAFKAEVLEAAKDITQQVHYRISEALKEALLPELSALASTLDTTDGEQTSLLQDIAERGSDIVKCAGYLFAGYVDGATQLAQSHGGGGGTSSDTGWGRKDDEDDLVWARRCLFRAVRMMRPAPTKRKMRR